MVLKVLLAASGSVSAVKVPRIALDLLKFAEVRIVLTKAAQHFIDICETYEPPTWAHWQSVVDRQVIIYTDEDEWWAYKEVGRDPVVHIELRKWADVFLVAPLTANTMAKLANGLCDNMLTSVARAWDISKPVIVAPAMNTQMWEHPFTSKHLETLKQLGYEVVAPISKKLACGDEGVGALAHVVTIVESVKKVSTDKLKDKVKAIEVWDLVEVTAQTSRSRFDYALSKLGTTELAVGTKHVVLGVADTATRVIFAYALITNDHKVVSVANLGRQDLRPILERIDFKSFQL